LAATDYCDHHGRDDRNAVGAKHLDKDAAQRDVMQRLNAALAVSISPPQYDVEATGIGIVHIGPGAFHRAHQAVFVEDALAHGGNWRICGVQMRSSGVRDALAPQDYRYTLAVLDEVSKTRVIHAVAEILVASDDLGAVFARLTAPSTHIVTLTITEKGYCLAPTGELDFERPEIAKDLANPTTPTSAIGLLSEALRQRRDAGTFDLTIISCDNLSDNGRLLGAAVRAYAARLDESLAHWIEDNVAFPLTMVDSITPATDEALRNRVAAETGCKDAMPVSREAFSQWVIEDRFSGPRPDWNLAGVTFTNDVALFESAKIRLLNGAHSALAYAGMLAGHETVRQAIVDEGLHDFVRSMMTEETCPTLRASPELDLVAYSDEILQRFRNPEIAYQLKQIAWDGSQKMRIRLFATIADNLAAGRLCDRLVYAVAAWLVFVRRCYMEDQPMTDPLRSELLLIAGRCTGNGSHDVPLFIGHDNLFNSALKNSDQFLQRLILAYDHISAGGRHHDLRLA
jgi:fructuronate reductase